MALKFDGQGLNIFPFVEGVGANPSGEVVEVILTTRIEGQLTPVVVKLSRQQASDLAALLTLAKGG